MTLYEIDVSLDEEKDERITITRGHAKVWVFEDSVVGEWQVHFKGTLDSGMVWVNSREEALNLALSEIGLYE